MMISEAYREMNRGLHQYRGYGNSGGRWTPSVKILEGYSILDYGCGKGNLGKKLLEEKGWVISEYDPAVPGKDAPPEPHDAVVCTDVLEHVEPEMLDSVLSHILSLMKQVGFFVVSTRPARKTLPDGRNAHLIVEPWDWWLEKLGQYFRIAEYRINPEGDDNGEVAVWVHPK